MAQKNRQGSEMTLDPARALMQTYSTRRGFTPSFTSTRTACERTGERRRVSLEKSEAVDGTGGARCSRCVCLAEDGFSKSRTLTSFSGDVRLMRRSLPGNPYRKIRTIPA